MPTSLPACTDSGDVNEYLREASGLECTTKDFRTWAGTVLALRFLGDAQLPTSERHARQQTSRAIDQVARELGNTAAVCRKSYVHPAAIEAYLEGELHHQDGGEAHRSGLRTEEALSAEERRTIAILRRRSVVRPVPRSP